MIEPALVDSLDQLTTPVLLCNGSAQIEHANPAFCAWMGIGARRWWRQPLDLLQGPQGSVLTWFHKALQTGHAERTPVLKLRPAPDTEREAIVTISPWRGPQHDIAALIEFRVIDDAFEQDPAVHWPKAMQATLKGLAHEVRNPLAGLRGAAQLLARKRHDPETRPYVEVIEQETARLQLLVERLLAPKPAHALESVNIHEVLERVRLLAESDAGWAVAVIRDYDPSLPPILGDRDRLIQAVLNIVRNALEASASEVRLRTRVDFNHALDAPQTPMSLRVDVIDNGRGVPDELAPQLFLPLVSGRAEGTGLGLALAQEIAREHGGMLSFRSRPGHTVFTLQLPFAITEPPPSTEPAHA